MTIYLVVADGVALEVNDPPGRKFVLERDEIVDPRRHPEYAIDTALDQGLIEIVSAAEAERATARLAARWAGNGAPGANGSGGTFSSRKALKSFRFRRVKHSWKHMAERHAAT